ncbi:MAG TPA: tRNA pseudouridine(13) synthase TruD [Myxococcaceae bacterium]|nr:tRNA pseudouridine(13) synthase TruD [Myxococcaceae bacterium]
MDAARWPRLTDDLPGTGGELRRVPEDFVVEELPAFPPTGAGDHLWLWVEKRGTDTARVVKALARTAGVAPAEVGYAGLKDRQAVTRQAFTVPLPRAGLGELGLDGVRILAQERTARRLRTGQLRGNRFRIRIREAAEPAAAAAVLDALARRGLPNYFGEQRFGRAGDNAARGRALLLGERLEPRVDRVERRLLLSAYQSLLFNRALAERMHDGLYAQALAGDVLRRADSGGLFLCEDPPVDQPRVDRLEVSPTGPIFGWKVRPLPAGAVAEREARLLAAEGLSPEAFRAGKGETEGARRAFAVPVEEVELGPEGGDLLLAFTLPKGSYATVLLDEVMKGPGLTA